MVVDAVIEGGQEVIGFDKADREAAAGVQAVAGRVPFRAISEAEDHAVGEADVVLPVVGGVGQIGGDEVGFNEAQRDAGRETDVGAASYLYGAAVGTAGGAGRAGKKAVGSENSAAQKLAVQVDGIRTLRGDVKRVARAAHH